MILLLKTCPFLLEQIFQRRSVIKDIGISLTSFLLQDLGMYLVVMVLYAVIVFCL